MKKLILPPAIALILSGCAGFDMPQILPMPSNPDANTSRPTASAPPPPANADSAEEFDTTSLEDRQDAVVSAPLGAGAIGKTVATLGDVADAGFWMETPLVSAPKEGRVKSAVTGRTVKVTLRPISGPAGAGSRLSLSALRLLDLPLAGLHELEVYNL
ncbi:D-galactarate dehydratase [Aliiroseovarius crassostreae]|uniref:D-galactarate dehydratase n=1 Tax=Aliiroseovarius crassostreae TaxID=154981 RepID=UPI003C7B29A8